MNDVMHFLNRLSGKKIKSGSCRWWTSTDLQRTHAHCTVCVLNSACVYQFCQPPCLFLRVGLRVRGGVGNLKSDPRAKNIPSLVLARNQSGAWWCELPSLELRAKTDLTSVCYSGSCQPRGGHLLLLEFLCCSQWCPRGVFIKSIFSG